VNSEGGSGGYSFCSCRLSSAGIYVGRFVRLNSWDILNDPTHARTASGTGYRSQSALLRFIGLYTLFFIFVYLTIYTFGHILQEQAK